MHGAVITTKEATMKKFLQRENFSHPLASGAASQCIRPIAGAFAMVLALLMLLTVNTPMMEAAPATESDARLVRAAAANETPGSGQGPSQDETDDNGGDDNGGDDNDDESEIYGQLVFTVSSFIGEWVIDSGVGEPVTAVLTIDTEVKKFGARLPSPGQWLKVKGVYLPDGRLDAKEVRPDNSVANQVIVRLKPAVDAESTVRLLAEEYEMSVESVLSSANIYLFTTIDDEEDEVNSLLTDDRIEWAELNRVSRVPTGSPYRTWKWGGAEDSDYQNQQAFEQVNLPPTLGVATGDDIQVAILDSGVDLEHPAFGDRLVILPNSDMISDTAFPDDIGPGLAWGHGTHVAGVIHAIAPSAQLLPIRVLDPQGRGNTFVLAYAIEYAVNQGADVINLSLGADCGSQILDDVIADAIARGIVIVAAAGNDASITPNCPAALPGVISVAAVEETRVRAEWSNYGAWVALASPGVGITSTFPLGYTNEITATPGYASWSGTSMATPFVAGAAALLLERNADFLHAMSIAERLTTYGDDISSLNPPPMRVGRHLNIGAALTSDLPGDPPAAAFTLFLPAVTR
jgi:subtilisin family serine protease